MTLALTLRISMMLPVVITAGLPGCKPPDAIAPVEMAMDELLVREYSGGLAKIEARLAIENPNDFEVSLIEADLELFIDEIMIGRVQWSGRASLGKQRTTVAPILAEMPVGEHGEIFTALIDRDPVGYTTTGTLLMSRGVIERRLPVEAAGRLNDGP